MILRRWALKPVYFLPVAGYAIYANEYLQSHKDFSKRAFLLNFFENTALYFVLGLYIGSKRFLIIPILQFSIIIWAIASIMEIIVIRKYGERLPKSMQWWELKKMPLGQTIENFTFYGVQSFTFYLLGVLVPYSLLP